ncbi:hypothetical protein QU487_00770 [Crenobacter sp. SG2305]|uniref:hypothetical protein n=1 Tax=Crenobacter oryzisoli TaxID=3056844 RepID=UPI0025AAE000|nr:hypothetical protein [Crenobacter sp. SG2305]MDN0081292.1 hypothetical protein [Crenobacter sp. SG2305]
MPNKILAVVAATVLLGAASIAMAGQGGNGHGGAGHNGGSNAGGSSAAHASTQGIANSNGLNAPDRDKGRARAADRHSLHASKHHKTSKTHHHHRKLHKPAEQI